MFVNYDLIQIVMTNLGIFCKFRNKSLKRFDKVLKSFQKELKSFNYQNTVVWYILLGEFVMVFLSPARIRQHFLGNLEPLRNPWQHCKPDPGPCPRLRRLNLRG